MVLYSSRHFLCMFYWWENLDDFTNMLSNVYCSQLLWSLIGRIHRLIYWMVWNLEANKSISYKIIFPCWRQRYKLGSGAQTWLEEECMRMMELDGIDGRQLTRGLDASNPPCWCGRMQLDLSWHNLVGLCSQLVQMPPVFTHKSKLANLTINSAHWHFKTLSHRWDETCCKRTNKQWGLLKMYSYMLWDNFVLGHW